MERSDLEKEYYMMFGKWPNEEKKKKLNKKKLGKEFTFDDVVEIEELLEDDD